VAKNGQIIKKSKKKLTQVQGVELVRVCVSVPQVVQTKVQK